MKCEKCLDKEYCPLYRGENEDNCWYEILRKNQQNKQEHNCLICKADCSGRGKSCTRFCEYFEG